MALIDPAVLEKKSFGNGGHIHVYSPVAGADNPMMSRYFFHLRIHSVLCCKFSSIKRLCIIPVFPIQTFRRPCRKIGQGQPSVIIYINFIELESLMLHAKFQDRRTSGSGGEDFHNERGGHLGHVTFTIYINFCSPFPRRIHVKFGFGVLSDFRGGDV